MGSSCSLYFGVYIQIPRQKRELTIKEWKCPTCLQIKYKKDSFCNKCGAEIKEIKRTEITDWSANSFWDHISELFNLDYDIFATFDPENYTKYEGYIYYPNKCTEHTEFMTMGVDYDGVYPMPSQTQIENAKAYFTLDFSKELECLREVIGDNVKIEYGLLKLS